MKTLIKSIIYCQAAPLDRLLMYIVKILCQASLPSSLTWLRLETFRFRSMINGNGCFSSAYLSLVTGRRSYWSKNLEWWVALELHVNATYYVQHLALKSSVYLCKKPVICGKLLTPKDSVWTSTESSKTSDLNSSFKKLVQKEALTHM